MAVHSSTDPTRTGARKLVFISTLDENTLLPCSLAKVTVADPMAESAMAPMNPPWRMPAGLAKRSSARIRHTVRPGRALSTQVIPRVSSQLGGTWIRGSATGSRYLPSPSSILGACPIDATTAPARPSSSAKPSRTGPVTPSSTSTPPPPTRWRPAPSAGSRSTGSLPSSTPAGRPALVPLDLSGPLGVAGPATSPGLLASFVVIRPGEHLETGPDATSELYYCLAGSGQSRFERPARGGRTVDGADPVAGR